MKDNDEIGDEQDRKQDARQYPRHNVPPLSGHPPIIITDDALRSDPFAAEGDSSTSATSGRDIIMGFDSRDGHGHYEPVSDSIFKADELETIDFVKVTNGQGVHTCPDVPSDCLIVVTDKKRGSSAEERIEIDATTGSEIVIRFPPGYDDETVSTRKKIRGPLKKIKSLEIFHRDGQLLHRCPEVGLDKDCQISICDDNCQP